MAQEMMTQETAEAGRGTDNVMAHLSLGEVVIPRAFLDNPEVMQALQAIFADNQADINQYTVGHESNSINPETGYPEFGFGKIFKSIAKIAAPAALAYFAPGIGTALGSSILGTGAVGASTLGNALVGGGIGGLTGGGLKGAALGALSGGIGANLGSFDSPIQGAVQPGGKALGSAGGSGILGAIGDATGLNSGSLSGLTGSLPGGSSTFNLGSSLSSAIGGVSDDKALKKAQERLLAGNQQQLDNIGSYDAGAYLNDPQYAYLQQEGDKAINRSLGAQGSIFSGRALQAATEQSKNLNTDFQNRYYQQYLNRVNMQNPLYAGNANTQAQTGIQRSNNLGSSLASILNPQKSYTLEELVKLGLA